MVCHSCTQRCAIEPWLSCWIVQVAMNFKTYCSLNPRALVLNKSRERIALIHVGSCFQQNSSCFQKASGGCLPQKRWSIEGSNIVLGCSLGFVFSFPLLCLSFVHIYIYINKYIYIYIYMATVSCNFKCVCLPIHVSTTFYRTAFV